ncbi:VanZ family protein [Priestia endophytica]|uniref:VanZ family protein n=1 Tax=Priestia endophytica TaxID=135735 RepID=UPI000F528EF3|nr:VanZ family protein [Priestia endophytica]
MLTRKTINIVFISACFLIFYLTLYPETNFGVGEPDKGELNLIPFNTIINIVASTNLYRILVNIGGNVLLFIPFGLLLPVNYINPHSLLKITCIGCLLSILIEVFQIFIPHRWTDIDDVFLNTIGTFLGYKLFQTYLINSYKYF